MNPKIAIIEDEEEIRNNLVELMEFIGYEVISASDGKEGVRLVKDENPDLIICDILMPEMDGYEVYEVLQENPETQLIPFIFLTAKADLPDIRKGLQLGVEDYIVKPYSSEDLIKSVKRRLEKAKLISNNSEHTHKKTYNYEESILLNSTGQPYLVEIKNIVYLDAQNQYTDIYLADQSMLKVRKSLKEWESVLPESYFLRIHRATIVNKQYIKKLEKWFNNALVVKLKNSDKVLQISQRYAVKIKNKLG